MILGAMSLDLFAVLLGGATALLPVFARDILQTGPLGTWRVAFGARCRGAGRLGLSRAFPAQAARGNCDVRRRDRFGIATIVFGVSRNIYLSLAALAALVRRM